LCAAAHGWAKYAESQATEWFSGSGGARVLAQPLARRGVFVGRVVIHNETNLLAGQPACFNQTQEFDPFLMAMLPPSVALLLLVTALAAMLAGLAHDAVGTGRRAASGLKRSGYLPAMVNESLTAISRDDPPTITE
jgi:hypothetical protein